MKKSKMLGKVMIAALPAILAGSIAFAQTSTAKKAGRKDVAVAMQKNQELQNKIAANCRQSTSVEKKSASDVKAARPCVTSVRKNPNEVTQTMLSKMPVERQNFVKSHPEKYTIVNN